MTTKDDFLFLKRSHVTHNNSYIDHNAREFSNLNLNQTLKNSYVQPVQLHSKTNIETQFDYNGKEKLQLSDKSFTDDFCSKIYNPVTHKDEVKMKSKKRWKKDNSFSSNTNSTLSLHIAAYENSVEVITNPLIENENLNRKKEKPDLIKKWKNADKIIVGSTPAIQISYEFPRQQEENCITDPEVMQFKASQQLLNSNQSITSFQQGFDMFKTLKPADVKLLRKKDKQNYVGTNFNFSLYLEPHQFKRGKQHCMAVMKNSLGKWNRQVDGFIIYYGNIKVDPATITKGIQGGVHLRATVLVVVFKASTSHPFESEIVRIEDNFAIGNTCGILTRFDLRNAPYIPEVGHRVKGVLLKYSENDGISTLNCALVE